MSARPDRARVATSADVDAIVDTLTTAFFHDPLWGPAFPDTEHRAAQAALMWRLYATSALRYSWLLVTQNVEAAAVWIPPGGDELTPQEAAGLTSLLERAADPAVARTVLDNADRFEAARPAEPHFYLTLLATHDRHRGHGFGMCLLADSLERIDALGAPAYLESSNPSNLARYASVGFSTRDRITTPTGHVVTTMWRPGR
ncbi:GNAT family N-acetyltransferase [Streptomyces sp. NBC_01005]|uniref:GNAT family N-acetyltransferase n=1 Tax=unclassified Streptomyces TaxID=2593676 RepID=UPI002E311876|nr:GNAT family N-acetyltransferase [Streptomyces sp. NBC_01362]WSW02945.1 GNAT family N-acetyltransferase [Streptomyces sp. NBC_01005]WTC92451.1 GNAT family N-acetyltransferase [Streptomyces sp. NBC_01650]